VVLGILLEIQKIEMIAVLLISAAVISLEMTNTAIERFVDAVSPEFNEKMGLVKDIMAGAVLFLSMIAVVIGILIFWKPFWEFIFGIF
jgi:diacylglycerol kinase